MTEFSPKPIPRREFLKTLPQQIVKGFHAVTKLDAKVPQIARIDVTRCHAWIGTMCQLCYLACPKRDEAIKMVDQKPVILASGCDGCGMCEIACQTVNDTPAIHRASKDISK